MNVVLVISDSMRRDHLPCYQPLVHPPESLSGASYAVYAPQLTKFANEAVVFDNAYIASFPTVPNRNDVFSGRYTYAYKGWAPLGDNEVILSETLNQAGFVTALFADTPHPYKPGFNYQRGFQAWDVIRGQENDPWQTTHEHIELPADSAKFRGQERAITRYLANVAERHCEEDFFPARTVRAATKWLEKNYRQPFFLCVDTFDPHEPWDPPEHYVRKYASNYIGEAAIYPRYAASNYLPPQELAYLRALYAGEVSLVDHWVGHLLQRIDDLGLRDDTMVIFTADHGFYLGEHESIGKSYMAPGRQPGLVFYPELARIPLIMRAPGCVSNGRRIAAHAQPVDIMPTVLDFLEIETPRSVQGHSLMPLIQGEKSQVRAFSVSAANISGPRIDMPNPANRLTITLGEWALVFGSQAGIRPTTVGHQAGTTGRSAGAANDLSSYPPLPELYYLPDDPTCMHNVINSQVDIALHLHRELLSFLRSIGVEDRHLACFEPFPDLAASEVSA